MDEGVFGKAAQERAIAEVEVEIARLCELLAEGLAMGLDDGREMVGGAMSEFLLEFFDLVRAKGSRPGLHGMVTLPLLAHGAETGEPGPAAPVAVVHLLWWASARHLDDLTDAPGPAGVPDRVAAGRKALTAFAVGGPLPARLLAGLPVPAATRAALEEELSRCWLDAVDGQLRDLTERPAVATPASVLRGYEGKTGAPYGMAAAAAACLAGADRGRVAGWRAFGRSLGVLRQLVNDQRDLASGRHEDLANGTATYLLVHLLSGLPAGPRREVLELHAAARRCAAARAELAARMLDEEVIEGYAASVAPLIERAHRLLDGLGGEPACVRELHGLVDATVGHLPRFRLAAA
ncbi:heptaprenyl diphosphate synthase [Actinomadura meyerae]|uniref:Heptaprenyl diphosphate synthase n=1 Tax=Actinomadura meyerae TaxID=240840 RepID=A0A239N038_9ACTN|nr:polyprenyl synthetase family protein [Actinomadura meyerae]SNT47499.1 heptaprenyl diphosphate synthase [Actinomadura meyerae]